MEGYAYSMKNQVNDKEKLGGKLSDGDKETITKAVDETISWLEGHQEAEKDEYEAQKKKLEEAVQPIVSKIYKDAGGQEGGAGAEDKDEL